MKPIRLFFLLAVVFLGGCKVSLYQNIPQGEANQMMAILMLHNINVSSEVDEKNSTVTLSIEKNQFINAVEILRQNGYPKNNYLSIEDVFPPGQLVSSPSEEKAKMRFLKEQQLQQTISNINGVISAHIAIAQDPDQNNIDPGEKNPISASAYIKYSPETDVLDMKPQIIDLIKNAVPGLQYNKISVLIQPAKFYYKKSLKNNHLTMSQPFKMDDATTQQNNKQKLSIWHHIHIWITEYKILLLAILGVLFGIGLIGMLNAVFKKHADSDDAT